MHIIIWEFKVKAGRESEFEQAYGPRGDWAALFQRHPGYVGTELLHDVVNPQRYVTMDRWVSPSDHEAFLHQWQEDYQTLDRRYEALTEHEALLGRMALMTGGR